jgi:PPOX class probable F420-dependent enzyme
MSAAGERRRLGASGRRGIERPPAPVKAARCLLTTFARTGAEVETRARVAVGEDKVYVRLAGTSPALERIWNGARVRVRPCTLGALPTGPAVEGGARVLSDDEDAPARRALATGRRWPRLLPSLPRDEELLYVEIVPFPRSTVLP